MNGGNLALKSDNPKMLKKQQSQLKWIQGLLVSAQNRKWFGKITIEVKRGMIDLVRSEESLKPPEEDF